MLTGRLEMILRDPLVSETRAQGMALVLVANFRAAANNRWSVTGLELKHSAQLTREIKRTASATSPYCTVVDPRARHSRCYDRLVSSLASALSGKDVEVSSSLNRRRRTVTASEA